MPNPEKTKYTKLKLEIALLKSQLNERNEVRNKTKAQLRKKWFLDALPTLLLVLTISATAFSLWIQSSAFLEERKKDSRLFVNEEMFEFVDSIKKHPEDAKRYPYLLYLTQYGDDALPALFYLIQYGESNNNDIFRYAMIGFENVMRTSYNEDETFTNILKIVNDKIIYTKENDLEGNSISYGQFIDVIDKINYDKKYVAKSYLNDWSEYLTRKQKELSLDKNSNVAFLAAKTEDLNNRIKNNLWFLLH